MAKSEKMLRYEKILNDFQPKSTSKPKFVNGRVEKSELVSEVIESRSMLLDAVSGLERFIYGKAFNIHEKHSVKFLIELKQRLEQLKKTHNIIAISTDTDRLRYELWEARNDELRMAWNGSRTAWDNELYDLELSDLRKVRRSLADERFYRSLGIFQYSELETIER